VKGVGAAPAALQYNDKLVDVVSLMMVPHLLPLMYASPLFTTHTGAALKTPVANVTLYFPVDAAS
jgi:hypothetical protein